jgi:NADPH2:quinone reductase|tara:strand:- start:461 stop:1459 length:999 start_codon:yes stop_codon:yes gene_type:complete
MKALQCVELAGPEKLVFSEVDDPKPGSGQVLLEIKAASVNFPDVLMIQGLYQNQPPMPFIPGAECSGVISEIGEGVDSCSVGDHVFVMAGTGCFAEKLVVDAASVTLIPKAMDFPVAAALPMTYGTSLYSLKQRANLQPGETLLVLGAAGGVGLSAVEIGKAMGARVIAAASSEEKIKICLEHGADEAFVYPSGDLDREQQKELSNKIKELTGGLGANVVYDPVGGSFSEPALRAMAWEGRFLVIGFAAGEIPKLPLNLALLKNCQIVGVFWGAWTLMFPAEHEKNLQELFDLHADGKINPEISDRFSLEESAAAIAHLKDRKAKGKVIIDV